MYSTKWWFMWTACQYTLLGMATIPWPMLLLVTLYTSTIVSSFLKSVFQPGNCWIFLFISYSHQNLQYPNAVVTIWIYQTSIQCGLFLDETFQVFFFIPIGWYDNSPSWSAS